MLLLFAQEELDDLPDRMNALHGAPFIVDLFVWLFGLLTTVFTIWMVIECVRKDPDYRMWVWIILAFPPLGGVAYLVGRWLPSNNFRAPTFMRKWTKGREIGKLESAAVRIGNPYHHIQLGDALRDVSKFERAGHAYANALSKEPANLQALWGAALVDIEQKSFDSARERLGKVLEIDPQYKFGDVSLAYGRTLSELQRTDEATAHLEKHVRRWRHPEGLYVLATLYAQQNRPQDARAQLDAMLMDIAASPRAIARRQALWKSKAKKMLRKLPA